MNHRFKPIFFLSFFLFVLHVQGSNSDIDIIKERVVAESMRGNVNDNQVEQLVNSIREDGTWSGINYEDVSNEGFEHRFHLGNMIQLARAYKTRTSKFYKSKKIIHAIELALKNWADNDYICENWWHNQIGTPNSLVTLMLIIGDDLPKDLVEKIQPIINRANIDAPGARPGGDRIKIAGIEAKNLLFLGEDEKFGEIVKVIEEEIKFTEWIGNEYGFGFRKINGGFSNRSSGGRGIQYDYSFHHRTDGVNNTLSYGLDYANAFVEWVAYIRGTKFVFSEEKMDRLIDYYLDGICKMSVYGKYPDPGAKNRSICRRGALHAFGSQTPELLLAATDYRKDELQEIVDIRKKGIKPTLSHATFYWDSEHFSFQRPDWFTSVRMYSTRVCNMEEPYNSEGILNHHRGDGVNHISITGDEYYDIWPVYDYQKIPGTTVMQKSELPGEWQIQKLGMTDFVGAVTDGKYGAAVFDFRSPHDPLIARKAWFFFDDEYVCLGAGISCKENLSVVTTLNQCLLRDDVTISKENQMQKLEKGEKEFQNVDWVYQDGVGYMFPQPTPVFIKNNEASGSWWRISKQSDSPKDEIKQDIFKLWIDHGKRPSDASYEYIVVPATTIGKLEEKGSAKNLEILSNTPEIQAVNHKALNMVQVVFYKAGEIQVNKKIKLISDTPGVVILKYSDGEVSEISVSDPARELREMHLSISSEINKEGENFKAAWNEKNRLSEISIDLPQNVYAGESVTVKL